jgi:hypothetical protein
MPRKTDLVAPSKSAPAGYSGTPLPKKLGVKPGTVVLLLGAPEGFEDMLGDLPDGAALVRRASGPCELVIWFPRSRDELESMVDEIGALATPGSLWIAWPKRASGVTTDLSEPVVRQAGLSCGLVDYKICAIDATYSGLKFTRRKVAGSR